MNHHSNHQGPAAKVESLSLKLRELDCVCCAEELETQLRSNPHIVRANVDFQADELRVEYHGGMISDSEIRELVENSGRCRCDGEEAADMAAMTDGGTSMAHLHHRAEIAPVTMGTKVDRMQYEMPATSAHAHHEASHQEAMAHEGHAGMDHDMSDPKMAKAMETDMRNRFFVSLLLTIPTVLYSPLGMDFLGLVLFTGPLNHNWLGERAKRV